MECVQKRTKYKNEFNVDNLKEISEVHHFLKGNFSLGVGSDLEDGRSLVAVFAAGLGSALARQLVGHQLKTVQKRL
jgi:hypothetical protein